MTRSVPASEMQRHLPPINPAPASPGLPVLSHQTDERVDLCRSDVFFQEFPIIVEQGSDGVFSQHIIAYLLLHEAKLLGYVLLRRKESEVSGEDWRQWDAAGSKGGGSGPRGASPPMKEITEHLSTTF